MTMAKARWKKTIIKEDELIKFLGQYNQNKEEL